MYWQNMRYQQKYSLVIIVRRSSTKKRNWKTTSHCTQERDRSSAEKDVRKILEPAPPEKNMIDCTEVWKNSSVQAAPRCSWRKQAWTCTWRGTMGRRITNVPSVERHLSSLLAPATADMQILISDGFDIHKYMLVKNMHEEAFLIWLRIGLEIETRNLIMASSLAFALSLSKSLRMYRRLRSSCLIYFCRILSRFRNIFHTKDEECTPFSTKIHIVLVLYLLTSWSGTVRKQDQGVWNMYQQRSGLTNKSLHV